MLLAFFTTSRNRVFFCQQDKGNAHDRQHRRIDLGGGLPTKSYQQKGRAEVGYSGTDVACTEDTQSRALASGLKPGGGIGYAYNKRATGKANPQSSDQ